MLQCSIQYIYTYRSDKLPNSSRNVSILFHPCLQLHMHRTSDLFFCCRRQALWNLDNCWHVSVTRISIAFAAFGPVSSMELQFSIVCCLFWKEEQHGTPRNDRPRTTPGTNEDQDDDLWGSNCQHPKFATTLLPKKKHANGFDNQPLQIGSVGSLFSRICIVTGTKTNKSLHLVIYVSICIYNHISGKWKNPEGGREFFDSNNYELLASLHFVRRPWNFL